MAWLAGWDHAKDIALTGQAGSGTDYQIELEIGDSAGGDFHLKGNCTNFPQDIEVTDDDGTTLLDFWIEDLTADPIVMQVKVADDLGSNQTVRIYYGKSGATTNSDGDATFDFFDPATSVAGWTGATTTLSIFEGKLRYLDSSTGAAYWCYKAHGKSLDNDIIFETKLNVLDVATSNVFIITTDADTLTNRYTSILYEETGNRYVYYAAGAPYTLTTPDMFGWQIWRNIIRETDNKVDYEIFDSDYVSKGSALDKAYALGSGHGGFSHYVIGGRTPGKADVRFDWFRVRKYNSPEPTFASAGAEQDAPAVLGVRNPPMTGGMV